MIIEACIAFAIVLPAVYLALRASPWLLDYAILVIALNRLIRRLVDFYINRDFNPYSLISLTPLVVACLMSIPAYGYFRTLDRYSRWPFYCILGALGYGLTTGILLNGLGAVYSLGEWLSGFATFGFAATMPVPTRITDRWIRSAGWIAMGVAAYGWWQYITIPVWDAFWVREVGFVGYLGQIEPTKMAVFSTMSSRGPVAGFLAWAVIPMILQKRWRNVSGWAGVLLILSCIMLTMTRTMFIVIAVTAIITPLLNRGSGLRSIMAFSVILVVATTFGVDKIPGGERIQERYATFQNITEDGSFRGRLEIYRYGWGAVLTNPIGYGLGSSGLAGRVSEAASSIGDSGYVQLFFQFGWLGAISFFFALYLIWLIASHRFKCGIDDPFVMSARGMLVGCMVFLFVGDIFSGFSLFWIFFGRTLNPEVIHQEIYQKEELENFEVDLTAESVSVRN